MSGLKTGQIRRIEKLYSRKVPPRQVATPLLVRELSQLSREIRRQIGVMITSRGKIAYVIVGTPRRIVIPDIREYRTAPDRLKGLRCVHTHLDEKPLTTDDLTDLALLRLDLMVVINVAPDGSPQRALAAHILPGNKNKPYQHLDPLPYMTWISGVMNSSGPSKRS